MGIRFERPEWLSLLALLPAMLALFTLSAIRRKRLLRRFAGEAVLPRLLEGVDPGRRRWLGALSCATVFFLSLAIARPQYGLVEKQIQRRGIDLYIALDVSESMLARDMPPNRLARAKEQLKAIVRSLKGSRVGIIAFAGAAYVQCPLTTDYALASGILDTLGPDSVPVRGTALGEAVRLALGSYDKESDGHKALVLLTDGEDQGSDPVGAAQEAAKQEVSLCAIGLGSEKGAPIPVPGGGLKQDREGRKVNSRLDFETLKKMAEVAGGRAIMAQEGGLGEVDSVIEFLETIEKHAIDSAARALYRERFGYFLLPAIFCLLLLTLLPERSRTRANRSRAGVAKVVVSIGLVMAMLLLPSSARAFSWGDPLAGKNEEGVAKLRQGEIDPALDAFKAAQVQAPNSPALHYNLGLGLALKGEYDEAISNFSRVADGDTRIQSYARYNEGVCGHKKAREAQKKGDREATIQSLEQSVDSYRQALRLLPEDKDAKINLEIAGRELEELKKLARQTPPPSSQSTQNQQSNDPRQQGGKQSDEQQQGSQTSSDAGRDQKKEGEAQSQPQSAPTPQPSSSRPSSEKSADQKDRQRQGGGKEAGSEQAKVNPGELTKDQAMRILNGLRPEKPQDWKNLFRLDGMPDRSMEKDW